MYRVCVDIDTKSFVDSAGDLGQRMQMQGTLLPPGAWEREDAEGMGRREVLEEELPVWVGQGGQGHVWI